jgi:hypothetical protein
MPQDPNRRYPSLFWPIVLIALGSIFLYSNWHPGFDPWPILWTYWPLLLIFLGLGKIYDSWYRRQHPDAPRGGATGGSVAAVICVIVILALIFNGRHWSRWHSGTVYAMQHVSRSVDRQNAKSVNVSLELPAGELNLSGGSSHLLEGDFDYRSSWTAPKVDYSVSGTTGELRVSQDDSDNHIHTTFRTTSDSMWTLHLANDIPMELKIEMGAGRGNLHLRDIDVSRLTLDMGAGQVDVDLTGYRKTDLNADIEGGVGTADILLPRNVGVIVNASGGLGSIDAHGLKHDGDEYTNEAYGKTPATIHLRVEGGVGRIVLREDTER